MSYAKTAFINCPFDASYKEYLQRLIFILVFYKFKVLMSVNQTGGKDRFSEIVRMIKSAKYTFHDLSKNQARKVGEFGRFNMPLELGVDLGCYKYHPKRKDKIIAILDGSAHSYDTYLSDLSGHDILNHSNNAEYLFEIIPTWLGRSTYKIYGPKRLKGYYVRGLTTISKP
jgi:hypothetical protein